MATKSKNNRTNRQIISATLAKVQDFARMKNWLWLTLMAVALTTLVILYGAPVIIDPDQCSFFATARFIAEDGVFHYREIINLEFRDAFWAINSEARKQIFSVHSPGLALLLAAVQIIFGTGAEHYFIPVCAGLCVLMLYALARFFLPRIYALGAAFIIFTCPILFLNALIKNSHSVSLLFTMGAMWLVFFANQHYARKLKLWRRGVAMLFAGILMGYSAVLRYPDVLLLLAPIAYLFTTQKWRWRYRWFAGFCFVGGAGISLGFLAWYNHLAFDSIFKTGYSLLNAQSGGFSITYIWKNLRIYLPGLVNHGFGPAFLLLLLPLLKYPRSHKFTGWFWAAWILPLFTLYHFYFWISADTFFQTLRFYINILPAFIILGMLSLRRMWRVPSKSWRWLIVTSLVLMQLLWCVQFTPATAEQYYATYQRTAAQLDFVKTNAPKGSYLFFTPDGQNFRPNASNLLAEHRWHIFAHDVFLLPQVAQAAAQNLEATKGKASTFQEKRVENLATANSAVLFHELMMALKRAENENKQLFYFGEPWRLEEFKKIAGKWFDFGVTIVGEQPFAQYRFLPQGSRLNYVEAPQMVAAPPLTITPLTLRTAEKITNEPIMLPEN